MNAEPKTADEFRAGGKRVRGRFIVVFVVLAVVWVAVGLLFLPGGKPKSRSRQAEWQTQTEGGYAIVSGRERSFRFDGIGDRVFVPDAPAFHFGTNDFSVEAWIKAYPPSSKLARQLSVWIARHPALAKAMPARLRSWISTHAAGNDFDVATIVGKQLTTSSIESLGFQFHLYLGRLCCQLSAAPMRPLSFQDFISAGPNLYDRRWHHVAMSVERNSTTGGKLYVDGAVVLIFDPTRQTGDLSSNEPLRIGNHANPNLRCFYKGNVADVVVYVRTLRPDEVAASYRKGPSGR